MVNQVTIVESFNLIGESESGYGIALYPGNYSFANNCIVSFDGTGILSDILIVPDVILNRNGHFDFHGFTKIIGSLRVNTENATDLVVHFHDAGEARVVDCNVPSLGLLPATNRKMNFLKGFIVTEGDFDLSLDSVTLCGNFTATNFNIGDASLCSGEVTFKSPGMCNFNALSGNASVAIHCDEIRFNGEVGGEPLQSLIVNSDTLGIEIRTESISTIQNQTYSGPGSILLGTSFTATSIEGTIIYNSNIPRNVRIDDPGTLFVHGNSLFEGGIEVEVDTYLNEGSHTIRGEHSDNTVFLTNNTMVTGDGILSNVRVIGENVILLPKIVYGAEDPLHIGSLILDRDVTLHLSLYTNEEYTTLAIGNIIANDGNIIIQVDEYTKIDVPSLNGEYMYNHIIRSKQNLEEFLFDINGESLEDTLVLESPEENFLAEFMGPVDGAFFFSLLLTSPLPVDDSCSEICFTGCTCSVNVLDNDVDPNGNELTLESIDWDAETSGYFCDFNVGGTVTCTGNTTSSFTVNYIVTNELDISSPAEGTVFFEFLPSATPSNTLSPSPFLSPSTFSSGSSSRSDSPSVSRTATPSTSFSHSKSLSLSSTLSRSATSSGSISESQTASESESKSPSISKSFSQSKTLSESFSTSLPFSKSIFLSVLPSEALASDSPSTMISRTPLPPSSPSVSPTRSMIITIQQSLRIQPPLPYMPSQAPQPSGPIFSQGTTPSSITVPTSSLDPCYFSQCNYGEIEIYLDQRDNQEDTGAVELVSENGSSIGSIFAPSDIAEGNEIILRITFVSDERESFGSDSVSLGNTIIDIVLQDTLTNELVTTLENPITICLEQENVDEDVCLGFFNTSTEEWECEDRCLRKENNSLCGKTDHLTSFALLLNGDGGGGGCSSSAIDKIIPWLSLAFSLICVLCIITTVLLNEIKYIKKRMRKNAIIKLSYINSTNDFA